MQSPTDSTSTPTTIRERLALLQLSQVGRPGPPPPPPRTTTARLPPRPPPRPTPSPITITTKPRPPPLPSRKSSRSSLLSVASTSSNNSLASIASNATTRSLPPVYTGKHCLPVQFAEKSPPPVKRAYTLPPPPVRSKCESERPALPVRRTTGNVVSRAVSPVEKRRLPPPPPPRLPARVLPGRTASPIRRLSPTIPASTPPPVPTASRPPPIPTASRPPPIPTTARPTATTATTAHTSSASLPCIRCYDFTAADTHAADPHHPTDTIQALSHSLTAPFSSQLDKSRVLFTWLHHNISYDAASFLAGTIPPQLPHTVLAARTAVCAGYASLFEALADCAGLEAVVVEGHGKGAGYSTGTAPREFKGNHAWNAVCVDGVWRLLDACWGAGSLSGASYQKGFAPWWFCPEPEVFGRKHYPKEEKWQLLPDGGGKRGWREYIEGGRTAGGELMMYTPFWKMGFETATLCGKEVLLRGGCEHVPVGDGWVFVASVGDGEKVVLQPEEGGRVLRGVLEEVEEGKEVRVHLISSWNGRKGVGLERGRVVREMGKVGWGMEGVCMWK